MTGRAGAQMEWGRPNPPARRLTCWYLLWAACLLPPAARADFSGSYSVNRWAITNTDFGVGARTNGSVMTPDGGSSVVLTGGNSGNGLFGGTTDFSIQVAAAGTVKFHYVYYSQDLSSNSSSGFGCGSSSPACDQAGYLLNGNYVPLADDTKQGSGDISLAVNAGDTIGFRVRTEDNQGEPGILTISNFNAPGPTATAVNVTNQVTVARSGFLLNRATNTYNGTLTVKNIGTQNVAGPLQVILTNLPAGVTLANQSGTALGSPYLTVPGITSLAPAQSVKVSVQFNDAAGVVINFAPLVYSGSF